MYGVNIKDFNDFITTLSTLISFGIEKDKLILDVLNNNNEILTKMLLVAFIFMINFLMLSTPFMIFYENYKRIVKKNELPLLKYSIIWYGIKYFSQNIYHKIFKFIKRIFMPKKGKII